MRPPHAAGNLESARLPALLMGLVLTTLSGACTPPATPPEPAAGPVTFNRDVAPIVHKRCAPCHRPGQVAPFSLLTYEEVKARANQIEVVTRTRYMPPWLPESGKGRFVGNRRLTVREMELLQNWLQGDLARGDPADLPPPPEWPQGWQLGEPDLVIRMPQVYTLPADGPDVVRNFVIPSPVDRTRYVRGVRVPSRQRPHRPPRGDPGGLHRDLPRPRGQGPGAGLRRHALTIRPPVPAATSGGWTPGKSPFLRPADMAWRLEPGTDGGLPAPHAPHRQAGADPVLPGTLLRQRSADQDPLHAPPGIQGDRHRGRGRRLQDPRHVPPSRGHPAPERLPPRPLHRPGDEGHGAAARRAPALAGPYPGLGLQLAGRIPLLVPHLVARRHDPGDGVHLRQLGGQPAQSAQSPPESGLRTPILGRDGGPLAPGPGRRREGSGTTGAGPRPPGAAGRRGGLREAGSGTSPKIPIFATRWPIATSGWASCPRPSTRGRRPSA